MALQSSASGADPLKLSEVKTEFGGATNAKLSDYLRGGSYVTNIAPNIGVDSSLPINLLSLLGSLIHKNEYTVTVGLDGTNYGYGVAGYGSLATIKNTLSPWGTINAIAWSNTNENITLVVNSLTSITKSGSFTGMEVVTGQPYYSADSTYSQSGVSGAFVQTWVWGPTPNVFGVVNGATRKLYFW